MEGITLQEHFASLEDPRVERTKHHQLLTMITIALCAVICGADTWVDVEEFGKSKRAWLEAFLELPNGIPSHDTDAARLCTAEARAVSSVFSRARYKLSTASCPASRLPLMARRPVAPMSVPPVRQPFRWCVRGQGLVT